MCFALTRALPQLQGQVPQGQVKVTENNSVTSGQGHVHCDCVCSGGKYQTAIHFEPASAPSSLQHQICSLKIFPWISPQTVEKCER